MRLEQATWYEVRDYLTTRKGIFLPMGSTEQHGPIGQIGTDKICATTIAERAAAQVGAYVAPPLAYTPAPFNMGFPGTMSITEDTFREVLSQLLNGLHNQGFTRIYLLNGHGANLAPARAAARELPEGNVRIQSWWDFGSVNAIRSDLYGNWEGMHATPSEIAMTQALDRRITHADATNPPRPLSAAYIRAHSGDRHGPPGEHKSQFPDGRVGSHSALATPEDGTRLLDAATREVAQDYLSFTSA